MNNFIALSDSADVSTAWLSAVKTLRGIKERSCHNLLYSINSPELMSHGDWNAIKLFDEFAESNGIGSITTVANTIFPLDEYLVGGKKALFTEYESEVYPKVKKAWGNYFDRMTRRRGIDGHPMLDAGGQIINPLDTLISKLKHRAKVGLGTKNHYELALADEGFELTTYLPERDRNYPRGGPCLSHLSFKIDGEEHLRLTAFYRSHYYLEKAFGNLVGLARLQAFVGAEAGFKLGPLTCVASTATLERSLPGRSTKIVNSFLDAVGG